MPKQAQIAVIGAGRIGQGIALMFARAGHRVTVFDLHSDALASLRARLLQPLANLGVDVAVAERVTPCNALGGCVADADVVFDAGPENLLFKQTLFSQLEQLAPASALLATHTAVIPINDVLRGLRSGQRAMGTHWRGPLGLETLVEVLQTPDTDPAPAQRMVDLLDAVGMTPILVLQDTSCSPCMRVTGWLLNGPYNLRA